MKHIFSLMLMVYLLSVVAIGQVSDGLCPKISVNGPAGVVLPGEAFKFRVTVTGLSSEPKYKWNISSGKILSGQGTIEIQVVTDQPGASMTATVEIDGLPTNCSNIASDFISQCGGLPISVLFDEYSDQVWKEERMHFPSLKAEMIRNPNAQIYVIIYSKKSKIAATNARIMKIKAYFETLKEQLTFVLQDAQENMT